MLFAKDKIVISPTINYATNDIIYSWVMTQLALKDVQWIIFKFDWHCLGVLSDILVLRKIKWFLPRLVNIRNNTCTGLRASTYVLVWSHLRYLVAGVKCAKCQSYKEWIICILKIIMKCLQKNKLWFLSLISVLQFLSQFEQIWIQKCGNGFSDFLFRQRSTWYYI